VMGDRSVDVAVVEECRVEQYAVMVKHGYLCSRTPSVPWDVCSLAETPFPHFLRLLANSRFEPFTCRA